MGDQKKTTILRAFNTHFFEFVDDLVGIFPEKQDIAVARSTFEWFKKANPTLFGGTARQRVTSPDGGPAKILSAADKFDKGLGKEMTPIELMTAGLQKQITGR